MRIPLPIVVLSALGVVGVVWWHGTRHYDFLTTPLISPHRNIAAQTIHLPPPVDRSEINIAAPAEIMPEPEALPEPIATAVPSNTGLKSPPPLTLYRDHPSPGAADMLQLSSTHESDGEIQHALLAAERVIDSSAPDPNETRQALEIIRRLRPMLTDQPADSFPITLHAGTGKSTAAVLDPLLRELANEIENASTGILEVSTSITPGRDVPENISRPPVAIWLSVPADDAQSSEVFIFTTQTPETLREDLAGALLDLLRGRIARTKGLKIPETTTDASNAFARMRTHVSRLVWLEIGKNLNSNDE